MFRSIVRVVYWIFGEMRKEGLVACTVIIVGRILYWGIFHSVTLNVMNSLCMSSRN